MAETPEVTLKSYERAIVLGDLGALSEEEKLAYYRAICESVGLNPLSKPFDFTPIKGKLALFANSACGAQLRQMHGISVTDLHREFTDGLLLVTVKIQDKNNRTDMSTGAVPFPASVEVNAIERANLIMAAETKAKRRATLSLCGLGMLDESEVESIREQAANAPKLPPATVAPAINQAPAATDVELLKQALDTAKPGETVTVGPALPGPAAFLGQNSTPSKPAAPPARPTIPAPPARPAPPPTPKPAAPASLNRQPVEEKPNHETVSELNELADRVARDKDPVPANPSVPAVAASPSAPLAPVPSVATASVGLPSSTSTALPAASPKPPTMAAPVVVQGQTAKTNAKGETPCTAAEFTAFVNGRGAKIARDKMKDVKNVGQMLKDYLLREAGETKLQAISATTFEALLSALENANVEDATKLLKGTK